MSKDNKIKRYDIKNHGFCDMCEIDEAENGRYVMYDDIKELEEQLEELLKMINDIPCTCHEMYKSRNLCAQDCPRCNWIDESVVEKIKGKPIEEVLNEHK